ncbi:OLC1v1007608C1 [Oldenlandia corymbosa var. corymbosa]|uniref:OLC1v1007608C1 n=1 Tax=Oldenlandia corymbosa var. corymbosa TaxID=529605 RepID=A0AAV1DN13_OLDCO|nr:OLC1v1007608C1 [Oldenlandia corymbosa var. corymbosa]
MAQQEEGWPLGLQPVNVRIGMVRPRNRHFSGSTSFNTLLSGSPSSVSDSSSSDLDTESTGSFFPDRSTTLGSLIGVPRIVNLPRRSIRASSSNNNRETLGSQKNCRPSSRTTWYCFSLCPTDTTDAESVTRNTTATTPSLAHFLEVERRAAAANGNGNGHRRSHSSSVLYGQISSDDYRINQNTLFVNGLIAPPPSAVQQSSSSSANAAGVNARFGRNIGGLDFEQRSTGQFPCMCG